MIEMNNCICTVIYVHGACSEEDFIRRIDQTPRLEKETSHRHRKDMHGRKDKLNSNMLIGFNGVDWNMPNQGISGVKISFIVTTSEHPDQIVLWMSYHRALGVSLFYLFTEGAAGTDEARKQLEKEPGVRIIPRDDKLAATHAKSRAWNETWLSAFFNKPCNHELFVKQSLNMESTL